MKKMLTVLFMFFFILCANSALAEQWHTASQITVAWNPVAPIEDTDTITYIVWIRNTVDLSHVVAGETADTSYTVSFSEEGKYHIGVSTKRVAVDLTELESEINWSDTNGEFTPNPFGVVYYVVPAMPTNLSIP